VVDGLLHAADTIRRGHGVGHGGRPPAPSPPQREVVVERGPRGEQHAPHALKICQQLLTETPIRRRWLMVESRVLAAPPQLLCTVSAACGSEGHTQRVGLTLGPTLDGLVGIENREGTCVQVSTRRCTLNTRTSNRY
jgi:hypothetical protein